MQILGSVLSHLMITGGFQEVDRRLTGFCLKRLLYGEVRMCDDRRLPDFDRRLTGGFVCGVQRK